MQNENFQMIYKLINMVELGKEILTSQEITSLLKKPYNSKLIEYFFNGYSQKKGDIKPNENFNENEEGDQVFAQEKEFVSKIL